MAALFDAFLRSISGLEQAKTTPAHEPPAKVHPLPNKPPTSEATFALDTVEQGTPFEGRRRSVSEVVTPARFRHPQPHDLRSVSNANSSLVIHDHSPAHNPNTYNDLSNTMSTPSMELSFGPQALPYVYRRHELAGEVVSSSPMNTRNIPFHSLPIRSVPAVTMRRDPDDEDISRVSKIGSSPGMSTWRQEQLKHMKKAKIEKGAIVKHISPLHGPPSLPYARNPSGVDATIADDSAYLGNVFGLQTASNVKIHPSDGLRVASDGTTTSTQSGSSSGRPFNSSASTAASSVRPLVIKNPHQNIGIRNPSSGKDQYQVTAVQRDYAEQVVVNLPYGQVAPGAEHHPIHRRVSSNAAEHRLAAHGMDHLSEAPATPQQVSKADASHNWRKTSGTGPTNTPATANPARPGPASDANVLSIDALFEKFELQNKVSRGAQPEMKASKAPEPIRPNTETSVPAENPKTAGESVPAPKARQPLSDTSANNVKGPIVRPKDTPPSKARTMAVQSSTTSAKGTPNAGKFLKGKSSKTDIGPLTKKEAKATESKGKPKPKA